jgi:hypothetical protein
MGARAAQDVSLMPSGELIVQRQQRLDAVLEPCRTIHDPRSQM